MSAKRKPVERWAQVSLHPGLAKMVRIDRKLEFPSGGPTFHCLRSDELTEFALSVARAERERCAAALAVGTAGEGDDEGYYEAWVILRALPDPAWATPCPPFP